jgi:hypothetical protein
MNKTYNDYKKYCEEEANNAFSNKTLGFRFGGIVNKLSTI